MQCHKGVDHCSHVNTNSTALYQGCMNSNINSYTLEVNHHHHQPKTGCSFWMMTDASKLLLSKVVVRKPTYKKWWLDFQGILFIFIYILYDVNTTRCICVSFLSQVSSNQKRYRVSAGIVFYRDLFHLR